MKTSTQIIIITVIVIILAGAWAYKKQTGPLERKVQKTKIDGGISVLINEKFKTPDGIKYKVTEKVKTNKQNNQGTIKENTLTTEERIPTPDGIRYKAIKDLNKKIKTTQLTTKQNILTTAYKIPSKDGLKEKNIIKDITTTMDKDKRKYINTVINIMDRFTSADKKNQKTILTNTRLFEENEITITNTSIKKGKSKTNISQIKTKTVIPAKKKDKPSRFDAGDKTVTNITIFKETDGKEGNCTEINTEKDNQTTKYTKLVTTPNNDREIYTEKIITPDEITIKESDTTFRNDEAIIKYKSNSKTTNRKTKRITMISSGISDDKGSKINTTITSTDGLREVTKEENNIYPNQSTIKTTTKVKSPDGKIVSKTIQILENIGNVKKVTDDITTKDSRTIKTQEERHSKNPNVSTTISSEKTKTLDGKVTKSATRSTTISNGSDENTTEKIITADGRTVTRKITNTKGPNNNYISKSKIVTLLNGKTERIDENISTGDESRNTVFENIMLPDGKTRQIQNISEKSNNKSGKRVKITNVKKISPKETSVRNIEETTLKDQTISKITEKTTSANETLIRTFYNTASPKMKTITSAETRTTKKGKTITTVTQTTSSATTPEGKHIKGMAKTTEKVKSPKGISIKETTIETNAKTTKTTVKTLSPEGKVLTKKTKTAPYKSGL